MIKTLSITNQKGGVGKTTTAVNLAACLSSADFKILLIDMDPQANATSGLGLLSSNITYSIYDVLMNDVNIEDVIQKVDFEKLDIAPSKIDLTAAELELVSIISRENQLKKKINNIKNKYDFIIIDCPPSLGLLTINALVASDSVLIPLQCEYYALEGLSKLLSTIDLVKEDLNSNLSIEGILLTMYDPRNNLSKEVEKEAKNYFGNLVFNTKIPRNVKLSEAPSYGQPIIIYDATCKGAESYVEFVKEFLARYEKETIG
ncbi:MAG: AAA family ATPase [Deferribacterota bacterium]|nr:AAA family ATPase [Deferribacterota bacterium]